MLQVAPPDQTMTVSVTRNTAESIDRVPMMTHRPPTVLIAANQLPRHPAVRAFEGFDNILLILMLLSYAYCFLRALYAVIINPAVTLHGLPSRPPERRDLSPYVLRGFSFCLMLAHAVITISFYVTRLIMRSWHGPAANSMGRRWWNPRGDDMEALWDLHSRIGFYALLNVVLIELVIAITYYVFGAA
jgi:hypothetical protein